MRCLVCLVLGLLTSVGVAWGLNAFALWDSGEGYYLSPGQVGLSRGWLVWATELTGQSWIGASRG